ncbi:hypothetical protein D2V08_12885 [Flagellimonas lutimaris]|uniref:Uncharacterized protein n=1 Tax=Flagellimonas lutimaris TaxID=475082 RepID=A0A3A1N745_9FLAO|nr:hypothetical protein [Allomuricauda lutimaris]RIV31647.1 hypothetical protein D2V08_12885 [Allomuricauda lutimaris]
MVENPINADFNLYVTELDIKNAFGPRSGYIGELSYARKEILLWVIIIMQKGFKFSDETRTLSSFDVRMFYSFG